MFTGVLDPQKDDRPAPIVTPARGEKRFRLEIEGLRALAALLVAVYHVWLGKVSGGVDVFFVVAGFMVTTTVLGHFERYGCLRIGTYFGRLMTRLLPNAILVLVFVAIATLTILPATSWPVVFREIAASALYIENWALIDRSVDYLARDAAASPTQHFWAMSVQGQFYVIWVLVGVLAFLLRGRRPLQRSMALVIALTCLASFTFSLVLTAVDQPVAYFHTLTRVWEFGAGGLIAMAVRSGMEVKGRWSTILGWAGLALIVSTGLALPVEDAFPGWAALWPVTGAVLILVAGRSPGRVTASAFLSHPILVRLGSVSYGIYLWHWPLLVLWLHVADIPRASLLDGALIIALSIALAFASTALVEKPLRSWAAGFSHAVPVIAGTALILVLAAAAYTTSQREPQRTETTGLIGAELVASVEAGEQFDLSYGNTEDPVPGVPAAAQDLPPLHADGCLTLLKHSDVVTCEYGDLESDRVLVLTGGSHSAHWLPGLDLAARATGWRVVTFIKDGCRIGYVLEPGEESTEMITCAAWNEEARERITALDPDLAVMTATITGRESEEYVPQKYVETWAHLEQHDIPVLAIRDTPRGLINRVECLATEGTSTDACDVPRRSTLADAVPTEKLSPYPENLTVVDLTNYFCDDTTCPAVIGNAVVYSDRNHITATYSRSLAERLADELTKF